MVSVIIAAYNEESVLDATLEALLGGSPRAEVIVVANGCTDGTADLARARSGVRVIELEHGSKPDALNAGDAAATSFPRLYLDADIRLPPGALEALCDALEQPGVIVAVPSRELDLRGRPWLVKAHSHVHGRLPVFRDSLFGRGAVALSRQGRARFGEFPRLVADDLFLDGLFTAEERAVTAEVTVTVPTPTTTRDLVQRLTRVRRGSTAMRAAVASGQVQGAVRAADRWAWLRDVVARDPRLIPSGLAYGAITLAAAARARRAGSRSLDWGRVGRPGTTSRGRQIGFLGIQCDTANLGLAALTYSTVSIINNLVPADTEFVLFSINSDHSVEQMRRTLGIDRAVRAVPFWHKRPLAMVRSVREIARCELVVDLTGGDSFSDIYGSKRLLRKLFHKQLVLATKTPLVLGPQTYGPLRRDIWRPWYRHVLQKARIAVTRDQLSADFLAGLTDRPVLVSTDVAVILPWEPMKSSDRPPGRRVAFNVSGLLWQGGYTGSNQFDLVTDYRAYCHHVVDALLAEGYEVEFVPHVLTRSFESGVEDDVGAAQCLLRDHPGTTLSPPFDNPVDAKSRIARSDVFIGSRMHATIAAFTSGVPTIPVAYSRKFSGFFGGLGYPVVVDLTRVETEVAVAETLALVADRVRLMDLARPALESAQGRLRVFTDAVDEVLNVVVRD